MRSDEPSEDRIDLRVTGPAVAAWSATAIAVGLSPTRSLLMAAALLVTGLATLGSRRRTATALLVAAAAALVTALHVTSVGEGPVGQLAHDGAVVTADLVVTSDPVTRPTRFGSVVVLHARIEQVSGRGVDTRIRSPVLVFAGEEWMELPLGTRLTAVGRLEPATDPDVSAVFAGHRIESVTGDPAWWWRVSSAVRSGVRTSVARVSTEPAALVPALVDGDDTAMSVETADEFRATGLTHLLAVSGTNLTLVVGFLLAVTRALGVRGYAQLAVGLAGTVGFVLLARPEPSVLRAAAMGLVALSGLGAGGRRRGMRVLSVAVLVLVLVSPWLARSVGFALSVLATAGILLLAPGWRDSLATWMPRWLAEAVAVPMAAQVMCTPLIAAISGQVSLVAVVANLLAGPVVGPATVLGLLGGLAAMAWVGLGQLIGAVGGWAAHWIIVVADQGAGLPLPALEWGTGAVAIIVLAGVCLAGAVVCSRMLRSPTLTLCCVIVLIPVVGSFPLPGLLTRWPPDGWVLVACDVGQGDALVLNAGPGTAVVVDTGPDPVAVDRCLDRLGVRQVPLVILTHPHADHIDGLAGVYDHRVVGEVEVTTLDGAPALTGDIDTLTADDGTPVRTAALGEVGTLGRLSWQVLGPLQGADTGAGDADQGEEGSPANNSSVVMRVEVRGVSLLLCGDVEPEAQLALLRWGRLLDVDVLKVPHHGSRYQDPDFLAATTPEVAIISVGADNDYGHPAAETLALLEGTGAEVVRTDQAGDVAVVVDNGDVVVQTR